jgi:FkbM family methyltransferase
MNPVRRIVQKFGFDLHKYRPKADPFQFIKNENIKTIFDIGANIGQFAKEARDKLPQATIYSFEPLRECFDKLNINMAGDENFRSFSFALGENEGNLQMNKSTYAPSSSLLPMAEMHKTLFPHTKEHTEEKIEIRRLDDIAKGFNLQKEILIKVDVQGYEDKVIAGGIETFKKAKMILIENSFVELYKGQPLFDDIYEKLKLLGFEYKGSKEQKVDRNSGKIISEDSIFAKRALQG